MLVHIVVINVLGNIRKQLTADLIGGSVEDDDVDRHVVFHEELTDGVHRHAQCLVLGIAEDARGNQREGYGFALVRLRQRKARPIAGNELLTLTELTAVPYRADGMYYILAGQAVRLGDFGVTGLAAAQRPALSQQLRPRRTMDATVYTTTAQEGFLGCVDDGIYRHFRYVISYNFERHTFHLQFKSGIHIYFVIFG